MNATQKQADINSGDFKNVKHNIKSGATVLAIGSIIAKILGALYRVPLTNVLGAQGMGLYQLVFPVYALFMILSTVGIPVALSRIVAEQRAMGGETKKYLFACMLILVSLSTLAAIIVFGLAKYIAIWQGNVLAYKGFWVIAPSLIFVGAIAGFRGWFQGEMYMLPTAVSNIIEQLVKLAVGLTLSVILAKRGVVYAVYGALVGATVSEFVALVYMFFTYVARSRKSGESLKFAKGEGHAVFRTAFPIAIVSVMLPLSNFFDSMIIVNMLKLSGLGGDVATSQYGLLSGPVNSLVNMPVVLTLSLAVAIVPSVAVSRVRRDISAIMLHSRLSVKLVFLIGVPFAIFFAVFSERLVRTIYPALSNEQLFIASNLLKITSFNVITLSAMQIYVSLLQAVDKTKKAVLSLGCAIIIKTVLQVLLTRYIGIMGSAVASVCMGAVALLFASYGYFEVCGLSIEKNIAINLVCGVIMGLVGIVVNTYIANDIAASVVGATVCLVVYVWTVFLFGLVGGEELSNFPAGKLLAKIHRIVRFWEYK
ncbi:MAG: polysaccharide biosynthesis protein [Clostridia bacterium]|nr:polysaccharide biosynthesis protein [Clostridia bacterium]